MTELWCAGSLQELTRYFCYEVRAKMCALCQSGPGSQESYSLPAMALDMVEEYKQTSAVFYGAARL